MSSEPVATDSQANDAPVVVAGGDLAGGDVAISVRGLSKVYQIYDKPQDRLKQSLVGRAQRLVGRAPRSYHRAFWALRELGFDVMRGEAVGIIGRNGSGKSTLLQLVCGTLTPTAGEVRVHGRVAALLELGAGFNPEFTGRENVYMSASILGLRREEIDAVYEDIVAFADIGDEFLDQPTKVYSSGMYMRLAFAVIAHVQADIMIIDEALAVGDTVFIQKCMRFLRDFRERGTLLFVSHDTSAVLNFCRTAVWLDKGEVRMQGAAEDVCNAYAEFCAQEVYGDTVKLRSIAARGGAGDAGDAASSVPATVDRTTQVSMFDNLHESGGWKSEKGEVLSVSFEDMAGNATAVFAGGERVRVTILARTIEPMNSPILGFFVKDRLGQSLFGEHTWTHVQPPLQTAAGSLVSASFVFTLPMLPNGDYAMTVSIAEGDPWEHVQHHWLHDAVIIQVATTRLRYGLVGIPFEQVTMRILDAEAGV
jgi:lipopolysaccharide transport system ATP-binding protein